MRRAAVSGRAGDIRGAVLIFRDITARKKRELALESTDQLRDFIYQGNLAGILHTTVDGRILDCNDAIVRMLGYSSAEELRGVRCTAALLRSRRSATGCCERCSVSREVREAEVCFRRRDNSRCWALINMRLLERSQGKSAALWFQRSSISLNASSGRKRSGKARRDSPRSCDIFPAWHSSKI